jgi:hypothetical protein
VKKRKEREEGNPSLRSHIIGRMRQRFDATLTRRWDIMPHNVLTNMKREIRRSTVHM